MKATLDKIQQRAAATKAKGNSAGAGMLMIPMGKISFDPDQPRQDFHTLDGEIAPEVMEKLKELADDIKANGLMHPITVREVEDGYVVAVGERRTRACQLLGMTEMPAKVRNDLEGVRLELYQLAENIQRDDLNENDLARQISKIVKGGGMQKQELAKAFNKKPAWITRYLAFADDKNRELWVKPGYITKAWILYAVLQLPEHIQQEALQTLKERGGGELTSQELKALEAIARQEKDRATQAAVDSAVQAQASSTSGAAATKSAGSPKGDAKANAIAQLLGDGADDNGDDDGYRPPADLVGAPGPRLNGGGASAQQPSYANDDPAHDFSGRERVGAHQMNALATSTVASRLSLGQLVAVFDRLGKGKSEVGEKVRAVAVDFRLDETSLRSLLEELGEEVTDLPSTALPLRLAEAAQKLTKRK
ncbi:ParB/RepB/Spo0J family partition protein [Trinickia mobilis]|uniref:ParB/RepB/Spo0J family partition protein n=1 Tax=Trinickia mobilis TaxID=2816356 RepID=UPI001A907AC6|nr:ParB/RepB/Spo0J family partition protein [Trinickia mobilis]